mgnify:FL=1
MKNRYIIGIMLVIFAVSVFSGCIDEPTKGERAKMLDTQPTKTLTESNERKIFMGYLEQVNNPNNIQFIYLMSWDGHVIYRSTVMGKTISATKSSEPYERITDYGGSSNLDNYNYDKFAGFIAGTNQLMNPSGMFGHDTPGVIWQDPEGNYYEWHNGPYFISNRPLKIDVPVLRNTDVDTELERKVTEMRNKLASGGNLSSDDKAYLMNN